jgi:hypothetical protein
MDERHSDASVIEDRVYVVTLTIAFELTVGRLLGYLMQPPHHG